MKTIWKYVLGGEVEQKIEMPQGAQIISCQYQAKDLCIWAIVDPKATKVKRGIMVQGTGWEHKSIDSRFYIATVQDGAYVWHILDMGEVMNPVTGQSLAKKLVEIFGLPNNVQRIVIDVDCKDIVKVFVQMVGDKDELNAAISEIAKAEFKRVDKEIELGKGMLPK